MENGKFEDSGEIWSIKVWLWLIVNFALFFVRSMFLFNSLFNFGVKQKTSYVTVTVMSDNHDNYSSDMKFWSNLRGKSFLFVTGKDSQCISKIGFKSKLLLFLGSGLWQNSMVEVKPVEKSISTDLLSVEWTQKLDR